MAAGGEDGSYPVQGYLIHWIIRGRSSIHGLIAEQPDEVRALLLESLRGGRFSSGTPFFVERGAYFTDRART